MEGLRSLVVKHRGAGEWQVKLPWSPWRFRAAQQERQDLLGKIILTGSSAGVFLINPDDRESLSDATAIMERPSQESSQWLFVRAEHICRAANNLHAGNWALFLINAIPDKALAAPGRLETVPATITRLMADLDAYACVLSSEDDIEWTVVEPGHGGDRPKISD